MEEGRGSHGVEPQYHWSKASFTQANIFRKQCGSTRTWTTGGQTFCFKVPKKAIAITDKVLKAIAIADKVPISSGEIGAYFFRDCCINGCLTNPPSWTQISIDLARCGAGKINLKSVGDVCIL